MTRHEKKFTLFFFLPSSFFFSILASSLISGCGSVVFRIFHYLLRRISKELLKTLSIVGYLCSRKKATYKMVRRILFIAFVIVCVDCLFQFSQQRLRNTKTTTNNVLRKSSIFSPPLRCSVDGIPPQDQKKEDPNAGPKLDFLEDYYSVLEVDNTVDVKELKRAYYKLVFQYVLFYRLVFTLFIVISSHRSLILFIFVLSCLLVYQGIILTTLKMTVTKSYATDK